MTERALPTGTVTFLFSDMEGSTWSAATRSCAKPPLDTSTSSGTVDAG